MLSALGTPWPLLAQDLEAADPMFGAGGRGRRRRGGGGAEGLEGRDMDLVAPEDDECPVG